MAQQFAKVAANLDRHPKVRRAGRAGREVFLFLLRRNADLELAGVLPAINAEPWYLADELMMPEAEAADGLDRAVAAGLLVLDGDQVVIAGWDDDWGKRPQTDAERQRAKRARDKGDDSVTRHGPSRTVTEASRTESDSHECHGSEKIREEEIRGEEIREPAPAEAKSAWAAETPEELAARRALANDGWARFGELRKRVATRIGHAEPRQLALQDPGLRELHARLLEAGPERAAADLDHVLAVLEAEAGVQRTLRWLDGGTFRAERWARLVAMSLDDAGKPPPSKASGRSDRADRPGQGGAIRIPRGFGTVDVGGAT